MENPEVRINHTRLHEIREDHDIPSLGKLADEIGISRPYLYQMLGGTRTVGLPFILRMYTRFGEPFTTATKNPLYRIVQPGDDLL